MVQFFFPALVLIILASAQGTNWLDQANLRSQEEMVTTAKGDWMKQHIETFNDAKFLTAGDNGANALSHRIEKKLQSFNKVCQTYCRLNIEAIKRTVNDQDTKNKIDIHQQRCQ